jgi:cytochrome c oxidase subunit 1
MDDLPPSSEAAASSAHAPAAHGQDHAHDHGHDHGDHEHHELGFIRTYIFSTDHKTIGIQYMLAGLILLLFGF